MSGIEGSGRSDYVPMSYWKVLECRSGDMSDKLHVGLVACQTGSMSDWLWARLQGSECETYCIDSPTAPKLSSPQTCYKVEAITTE